MKGLYAVLALAMTAGASWESWPPAAQSAARAMTEKYGEPGVVQPDQLVWRAVGPWKRVVVRREEVQHDFPRPHKDVLLQTIHYRLPAERVDDVVAFDGSLVYDRTQGELTASCDTEEANLRLLNLANRVAQGKLTVEQARRLAARGAGTNEKLEFSVAVEGAADPDQAISAGSSERLQDEEPPTAEGPPR